MSKHTISIDFDVFKVIQTNRRGFEETENEVLRRLLDLSPTPQVSSGRNSQNWERNGAILPHRTKIFLDHQGVRASGEIRNGIWVVEGKKYSTPSQAAISIVEQKRGEKVRGLNGWMCWSVKRPGDSARIPLDSLRTVVNRRRR